jgi:hypothetical protein
MRSVSLRPIPDPWLDPEMLSHLNAMFYDTDPSSYFETRFRLLAVWAGRPEAIEGAISEGVTYEGLALGVPTNGAAADELGAGDDAARHDVTHRQFVIGETIALLHHAGETLIRFFLAHARFPPCPWVEIVSERPAGGFKRTVESRFDGRPLTPKRRATLARVFFGTNRLPDAALSEADWFRELENIERWLAHFATRFVHQAEIWNGVKHGLAIRPAEPRIAIDTLVTEGPGVTYLARDDARRWTLATRWTNPSTVAHLMGEIYVAYSMLGTIWQVGRRRYLEDTRTVRVYTGPPYEDYVTPAKSAGPITSVRADILYRYPILVCFMCGREPRDREHARVSWRVYESSDDQPRVVCSDCLAQISDRTA